ncbi:MAG TPA: hypothetical protein ENJ56_04735 [Anaerolineae bacterium]|nr:hypothetical protein [Anaerolineae bacterium]
MRLIIDQLHHLLQCYDLVGLVWIIGGETAAGDAEQIERLACVSPIAWRHVNFQGRYEFRQMQPISDIDELVQTLAQHPITLVDLLDYSLPRGWAKLPLSNS